MSESPSYKQLVAQRAALEAQIADARRKELAGAVAQVQDLIKEFGLTANDVFPSRRGSSAKGTTVAPKYRDPATGATWTGRGKPPTWIKDQDREKFAI